MTCGEKGSVGSAVNSFAMTGGRLLPEAFVKLSHIELFATQAVFAGSGVIHACTACAADNSGLTFLPAGIDKLSLNGPV